MSNIVNQTPQTAALDQLECWQNCYGSPLTIAVKVKVSSDCEFYEDFKDHSYYVTSLVCDNQGINIGINDGSEDSLLTCYSDFRINELTLA